MALGIGTAVSSGMCAACAYADADESGTFSAGPANTSTSQSADPGVERPGSAESPQTGARRGPTSPRRGLADAGSGVTAGVSDPSQTDPAELADLGVDVGSTDTVVFTASPDSAPVRDNAPVRVNLPDAVMAPPATVPDPGPGDAGPLDLGALDPSPLDPMPVAPSVPAVVSAPAATLFTRFIPQPLVIPQPLAQPVVTVASPPAASTSLLTTVSSAIAALMLLYRSSGCFRRVLGFAQWAHESPDFSGEKPFETADDLGLCLALGSAAGDVGLGRRVVLHAHDDGPV